MKLRNKIINYFVVPAFQGEAIRVVRSKFTINPKEGKELLSDRFKKDKQTPLPPGDILQVCFDTDSGIIYAPNASEFLRKQLDDLLVAVKFRIIKDFGDSANRPIIESNPFTSLRIRSLESFGYAQRMIKEYFKDDFDSIPIVEANISKMPHTLACLPSKYVENPDLWGSYIGSDFIERISFYNENGTVIHQQKTPFILINIANKIGATEKEWVVLNSYNDHFKRCSNSSQNNSDLYAIKRLLYMGWTLEEVSGALLENASSIVDILSTIDKLMGVVDIEDCSPYYLTFKINDGFPISLNQIWDKKTGVIDVERQISYLKVIDYDMINSCVMLETPVFIPPKVCKNIFNIEGKMYMAKYNQDLNTIDVKIGHKDFVDERQLKKIRGVIGEKLSGDRKAELDFSGTLRAQGAWATSPAVFNIRKISDYGYATEFIKEMCEDNKVDFKDFKVVSGAIECLFGRGVQGGFMNEASFREGKLPIPFHLVDDIYIEPPVIFLNTLENSSYPEQTEVLIHEYRHYIYGIMNPTYNIGYTMPQGYDKDGWSKYLSDPNEKEAHRAEIRFGLKLGRCFDEIIRSKVGGMVTRDNYLIAVKFSELVNEVMNDIEEEEELSENVT